MKRLDGRLLVLVAGFALGFVLPNLRRGYGTPPNRACFCTQKTLEGSLELYALDRNVALDTLTPTVLDDLRRAGYLQSRVTDPGEGLESAGNYRLAQGKMVCLRHGFIRPPAGCDHRTPAREQLRAAGVTDPELLAQASDEPPYCPPFSFPRDPLRCLAWTMPGAVALALGAPLLAPRRRRPTPMALARGALLTRDLTPARTEAFARDADVLFLGPTSLTLARAACPVCGQGFEGVDAVVTCRACDAPHHVECWDYAGGCATYGCRENA